MKDFEKTETEVTITYNYRRGGREIDGRRVRVVFEREMYNCFSRAVENLAGVSMEAELDNRLLVYFQDLKNFPEDGPEKIGRQRGIKSVTFLDERKKDNRPPLIF